ncbi:MAG: hypothetical protein KC609_05565 [Myxococcales bacterium]|nr:hypothetical protein [Myxococcales bacterium]
MTDRAAIALVLFAISSWAVPLDAHEFRLCVSGVERIAANDRGYLSLWASYRIAGEQHRGRLDLDPALADQALTPFLETADPTIAGVQLTFTPSGVDAALVADLSGCDPVAGSPKEFPLPSHGPTSISPTESAELLLAQLQKKKSTPILAWLLLERRLANAPRRLPPTIRITSLMHESHPGIDALSVTIPATPTPSEPIDSTLEEPQALDPGQGCRIGGASPSAAWLFIGALFLLIALRRPSSRRRPTV